MFWGIKNTPETYFASSYFRQFLATSEFQNHYTIFKSLNVRKSMKYDLKVLAAAEEDF